jgi:hypothetical protein
VNAPKKQRGQKNKVAPGKSYTAGGDTESDLESSGLEDDPREEEDEEVEAREEEDEEMNPRGQARMAKRRWNVLTSDEEDELEAEDEDEALPAKSVPEYPVGAFVVALYDGDWYVAQVEGEEPENECPGFTLLKYMERKGKNQFVWGKNDTLKTINSDILLTVDPPIPVSSRLLGLPKETVLKIENILMVKWSIIVLGRFLFEHILYGTALFSIIDPSYLEVKHLLNPNATYQYYLCFCYVFFMKIKHNNFFFIF